MHISSAGGPSNSGPFGQDTAGLNAPSELHLADMADMADSRRTADLEAHALFLNEALRFLEDACRSWHALATRWTEAGDLKRAADALEHAQECERRRIEVLAALGEPRQAGASWLPNATS